MTQTAVVQTKPIGTNAGTNYNPAISIAIVAFLILNALKIALFNGFLITKQDEGIFIYKFILTLLVVTLIYPLIYRAGSRITMAFFYVLQVLYMTVSLGYYLYFRSYLHILQYFSLFREAFSVAGNSAVPFDAKMLVVLIDLPVFIFILAACKGPGRQKIRLGKTAMAAMLASLLILASIETFNYVHKDSIINMVKDTFTGESPIVERYGTLADNIVDLIHNGSNNSLSSRLNYGKEQSSGTQPVMKSAEVKNPIEPAEVKTSAQPNYILIQVESMDANIVNQMYKGSYVTPYLHALESKSVYYPYTMSYHEGGGTSDCEFSVLNSVEPLSDYPALKLSGYDYPNSMVKILNDASYTTLAFHGNVGSFYNRDVAFPRIGYSGFYDMQKMQLPESGWGLPDDAVFNYAFNNLKTVNGVFFAHVITMTSHEPFNSARNYYNNSLYDDIGDKTVKEYYNSMSYVDKSIQDFVNKVQANFKNTYIIIYGDHTPNIKSSMYSQASFSMNGKYFEFVPMMIVTPDGTARKEKNEVASFLDIAPTVLKTSGIPCDFRSDGLDLAGSAPGIGNLPFKGGSYDRSLLFTNASATGLS
jgi:lipoteichoic acid synthase